MTQRRPLFIAKFASLLLLIPAFLYADSGGVTPGTDAGYAGVNGEGGSCAACHTSGSGAGSVAVTFPTGLFYTPGTKQHLIVTITDTPQQMWGFQLTTRPVSSATTQAGTYTPGAEGFTQVVCAPTTFNVTTEINKEQFGLPCPSSLPLQYIEQSFLGTRFGQKRAATFEFDWTPPSTDVGPIQMNVSSVAADGDGTTSGDHVYNKTYTLTRIQANQPLITNGGVVNGASFQGSVSPGSWVTIQGTNLANSTRPWASGDFVKTSLPASLDGVSVTMDGKPAYVSYISPTQVNVQAPSNTAQGTINVAVNNNGVVSNTSTVTMATTAPAFFLWSGKYAVATRTDFSLAAPVNLFPGVTSLPAKPGDTIILWCLGLGVTNPAVPAGILTPTDQVANVVRTPVVSIANISAQVIGAAYAPGFAGLYQVSVQIPNSLGDGDQPITIQANGITSPSGVFLTIQH